MQCREVMSARDGERRRGCPRSIEAGFDTLDASLRDPALVVVRERGAVFQSLRVEQPEQQLPDPRGLRPAEEARHLVVIDIRIVERDAAHAIGVLDRHRERHRGPPRVTDDRCVIDAKLVEHVPYKPGFAGRRVVTFGPAGPAKALEVERDHAVMGGDRGGDPGPALERSAVAVDQHDRRPRSGLAIAHVDAVDLDERRICRRARHRAGVEARTAREGERERAWNECSQGISLRTSASLLNSVLVSEEVAVAVATEPKHSAIQAYERTVRYGAKPV